MVVSLMRSEKLIFLQNSLTFARLQNYWVLFCLLLSLSLLSLTLFLLSVHSKAPRDFNFKKYLSLERIITTLVYSVEVLDIIQIHYSFQLPLYFNRGINSSSWSLRILWLECDAWFYLTQSNIFVSLLMGEGQMRIRLGLVVNE